MNWYRENNPHRADCGQNSINAGYRRFKEESKAKKNYEKFLKEIRAKKQSLINQKERIKDND